MIANGSRNPGAGGTTRRPVGHRRAPSVGHGALDGAPCVGAALTTSPKIWARSRFVGTLPTRPESTLLRLRSRSRVVLSRSQPGRERRRGPGLVTCGYAICATMRSAKIREVAEGAVRGRGGGLFDSRRRRPVAASSALAPDVEGAGVLRPGASGMARPGPTPADRDREHTAALLMHGVDRSPPGNAPVARHMLSLGAVKRKRIDEGRRHERCTRRGGRASSTALRSLRQSRR